MLNDPEFGEVIIRKNSRSRSVSFSISTSGRLQATVPSFASDLTVKRTLDKMRGQIRQKLKVKDPSTQRARDLKKKLLTKQAKEYLPITISLNIGLMQVPEAQRDYVIIHELAHINHPDHSKAFWAEVESHDPDYRAHRELLNTHSPGV